MYACITCNTYIIVCIVFSSCWSWWLLSAFQLAGFQDIHWCLDVSLICRKSIYFTNISLQLLYTASCPLQSIYTLCIFFQLRSPEPGTPTQMQLVSGKESPGCLGYVETAAGVLPSISCKLTCQPVRAPASLAGPLADSPPIDRTPPQPKGLSKR